MSNLIGRDGVRHEYCIRYNLSYSFIAFDWACYLVIEARIEVLIPFLDASLKLLFIVRFLYFRKDHIALTFLAKVANRCAASDSLWNLYKRADSVRLFLNLSFSFLACCSCYWDLFLIFGVDLVKNGDTFGDVFWVKISVGLDYCLFFVWGEAWKPIHL